MKRTFITFADGESNEELASILRESLSEFSRYGLEAYNRNSFDVDYGIDSDPEFWQSGKGYVYKILSCIKALEEFDEAVWIDTDCVATSYIDKIWFESWRLNGYPLLPRARFYLFGMDLTFNAKIAPVEGTGFLGKGKEKLGVQTTKERDFYSQACFMYFDRSCLTFFKEVLSLFSDFDREAFPFGDESIINCLLWRDRCTDNLKDIFICSKFFGFHSVEIASMKTRDQFMKFRYAPATDAFENIMFYHGSKSPEVAKSIFSSLKMAQSSKYKIDLNRETALCEIMRKSGSDKSTWHNYTKIYDFLFSGMIENKISIFELGLGTNNTDIKSSMKGTGSPGGSLRAWREYFIDAKIFGADIDRNILFEEEGIKTFYCDQTDAKSIEEMWSEEYLKEESFDIIIDDGLHEYEANLIFLESSIHKLKSGGIYVIEDMLQSTAFCFRKEMPRLEREYKGIEFQIMEIPYERNSIDNTLLIARKIF